MAGVVGEGVGDFLSSSNVAEWQNAVYPGGLTPQFPHFELLRRPKGPERLHSTTNPPRVHHPLITNTLPAPGNLKGQLTQSNSPRVSRISCL